MLKERNKTWDNIKGALIFLVVFAHFLLDFTDDSIAVGLIFDAIYFFHMPVFAVVSGYFSHERSKVGKLITAYVIFNGIFIVVNLLQYNTASVLVPYYCCWYLLALAVWRLVGKYLSKIRYIVPVLFVIAILAGFVQEFDNTLAIGRIIGFFPFFMAGYKFKDITEKLEDTKRRSKSIYGVIIFLVMLVMVLGCEFTMKPVLGDFTLLPYTSPIGAAIRVYFFLVACIGAIAIYILMPNKELPLLTKWGRNSMSIYLLHRGFALAFGKYVPGDLPGYLIICGALLGSVIVTFVTGTDVVSNFVGKIISPFGEGKRFYLKLPVFAIGAMYLIIPISMFIVDQTVMTETEEPVVATDIIYRKMSASQEKKFDNAYKIVFAGDLILLEDQVKLAYDGENYDFSSLFEYTKDEIESADFAIGVFEGPAGGEELGYTTSNYADGVEVRLNFPDEFAYAVKDAGFDLVTTSNNHLLDSGLEAAQRTNDVLDAAGLMRVGTYKDQADKDQNNVFFYEEDGIKFAVLSYTFSVNFYTMDEMINGDMSYLSGWIAAPGSEDYERTLEDVKKDFEKAKEGGADLIIVLPHWGTQFADEADDFQIAWRQNFIDMGADIILGDHTHSVQPAFLEEHDGRNVFTVYSPGNYANIYREYDGDASALVEVYIDRDTKEVIGGGIVPMWTAAQADGNYRAIPVYDIMNDEDLRSMLTTDDIKRVKYVEDHISTIMLGQKVPVDNIEKELRFDKDGFMRSQVDGVEITNDMKGELYNDLTSTKSVCFVGDSITYGTKNGGVPWYEPLLPQIKGEVLNMSFGGWTTLDILNHKEEIGKADLYVIAIGTNDVRYADPEVGADNAEDYKTNITAIRDYILSISPDAKIWFIAPWTSTDGDTVSPLSIDEVIVRRSDFSDALKSFCDETDCGYIDPNPMIDAYLLKYSRSSILLDHIHPNVSRGVDFYCEAVLKSDS